MIKFFVGERPSDPLVITVTGPGGTPRNLSGYSSVEVVAIGEPLPAGVSDVSDAAAGKVQYDFTAPFTTADVLTVRVKMTTADGDVDYSDAFTITVEDPADPAASLITTVAAVEGVTGTSVTSGDLLKAQNLVSLVVGRDLGDPLWFTGLRPSDQFWLRSAVSWQAADLREKTLAGGFTLPYVPGASSISNGDISVSYSGSSDAVASAISSYTALALRRLSWMQPMRSVHAAPFIGNSPVRPDPWQTMYRVSM